MMRREKPSDMVVTLDQLNACDQTTFVTLLKDVYSRHDWVAARAALQRPFPTLSALKLGLQRVVNNATHEEKIELLRGHSYFAKAGDRAEKQGGEICDGGELEQLNYSYCARFDFPFVLSPEGERSTGRRDVVAIIKRRLSNQRDDEIAEALHHIGRSAELRLNYLFNHVPHVGHLVLDWSDTLGTWSDDENCLTCAFMTTAHRKTAVQLAAWMRECGMEVSIDTAGNVIGRYVSADPAAKTLMIGSHYDTARDSSKLKGRLGILLPIAVVRHLHSRGVKLPFHLEIVGFSDSMGLRFNSPFLGSKALAGRFDMRALDNVDSEGLTLQATLHDAGYNAQLIPQIARRRENLLGFVEVAMENGPILRGRGVPAGVVSSIAGSSRYMIELTGTACHAGNAPMSMRRDAAAAAAEVVLLVERCCSGTVSLSGTVGEIEIPNGAASVVPGGCRLILEVRAANNATRDRAVTSIMVGIDAICYRRNMDVSIQCVERVAAVNCDAGLRRQLGEAAMLVGVTPAELAAGTAHDAMEMAGVTDVAMLLMRCDNEGSGEAACESVSADDIETAWELMLAFIRNFDPQS
ncbi:hydantoinase/carbamoylase family amidase [Herbaspirillum sp. GCM10030257]|uniref:hydantoinase/carbamoylase family amidase n=1 Tax=Herbaspirillum sp. GCM10030257 TaxID=3273393 RepID=UPI00360D772B